jgi:hypothetical protein
MLDSEETHFNNSSADADENKNSDASNVDVTYTEEENDQNIESTNRGDEGVLEGVVIQENDEALSDSDDDEVMSLTIFLKFTSLKNLKILSI